MVYVQTLSKLTSTLARLNADVSDTTQAYVAIDVETFVHPRYAGLDFASGLDPHTAFIRTIQLVPLPTPTERTTHKINPAAAQTTPDSVVIDYYLIALELDDTLQHLEPLTATLMQFLGRPNIRWCGHNLSFDLRQLWARGLDLSSRLYFDSMLIDKVLLKGIKPDDGEGSSLKGVARRYTGQLLDKTMQVSDWGNPTLTPEQIEYAAQDTLVFLRLVPRLLEAVQREKLTYVADLECSCLRAMASMEYTGMKVDLEAWLAMRDEYIPILEEQGEAVLNELPDIYQQYTLRGELTTRFNAASPSQLLLKLKQLNVPIPSTGDRELGKLPAGEYPVVEALRSYRKTLKLMKFYLNKLPEKINPVTGRIHPGLLQMGTDTGRISGVQPNLMQIPRGQLFRSKFIADPGHVLVIADYSQIEPRILAELSGDDALLSVFDDPNNDLYKFTGANVFGISIDDVTKEIRNDAKVIVLGFQYSMGAEKFKDYVKLRSGKTITLDEAKRLREAFFRTYPKLGEYHRATGRAIDRGVRHCTTLSGRVRAWPKDATRIYSSMVNAPVQGTSADITKAALRLIQDGFEKLDYYAKLLLPVHDEIVATTIEERSEEVAEFIKFCMIRAAQIFLKRVRVDVSVGIGTTWADK